MGPYKELKSAKPVKAEDIKALRQRVERRVFAGGHSYGGRQTAMAAEAGMDLLPALA